MVPCVLAAVSEWVPVPAGGVVGGSGPPPSPDSVEVCAGRPADPQADAWVVQRPPPGQPGSLPVSWDHCHSGPASTREDWAERLLSRASYAGGRFRAGTLSHRPRWGVLRVCGVCACGWAGRVPLRCGGCARWSLRVFSRVGLLPLRPSCGVVPWRVWSGSLCFRCYLFLVCVALCCVVYRLRVFALAFRFTALTGSTTGFPLACVSVELGGVGPSSPVGRLVF